MQEAFLDYTRVGGPPWNWYEYKILYEDGSPVPEATECDVSEGWVKRYMTDEKGHIEIDHTGVFAKSIVEYGNFIIAHKYVEKPNQ